MKRPTESRRGTPALAAQDLGGETATGEPNLGDAVGSICDLQYKG
jgi:hypothetical protein